MESAGIYLHHLEDSRGEWRGIVGFEFLFQAAGEMAKFRTGGNGPSSDVFQFSKIDRNLAMYQSFELLYHKSKSSPMENILSPHPNPLDTKTSPAAD